MSDPGNNDQIYDDYDLADEAIFSSKEELRKMKGQSTKYYKSMKADKNLRRNATSDQVEPTTPVKKMIQKRDSILNTQQ